MFWNHVVTSGLAVSVSILVAGPALATNDELPGGTTVAAPMVVAQAAAPSAPKMLQKDKAGDSTSMPEAQTQAPTDPDSMAPSPETVAGQPLYNLSGEEIAQVDAVFVEPNTEREVAVLSYGGFLGIGDRQVTIPYEKISVADDKLITDLTLEALDQMPEYQPPKVSP